MNIGLFWHVWRTSGSRYVQRAVYNFQLACLSSFYRPLLSYLYRSLVWVSFYWYRSLLWVSFYWYRPFLWVSFYWCRSLFVALLSFNWYLAFNLCRSLLIDASLPFIGLFCHIYIGLFWHVLRTSGSRDDATRSLLPWTRMSLFLS